MKTLANIWLAMLLSLVAWTAPPASPVISLPQGPATVLTNVTVSLPVGVFRNGTVYEPAKTLVSASAYLTWTLNLEPDFVSYELNYGDVVGTVNSTLLVGKSTNVALFKLNTNITYYFYSVAINAGNERSAPSSIILYQPSK